MGDRLTETIAMPTGVHLFEGSGRTVRVDGEPEFQRITVMAEHGCFLWAIEPESGEERLVGIDFDLLGTDVAQPLVEHFLQWHSEWEEAHKFIVDPSCERPGEEWFQDFHADGRALAKELSSAIGQPVEYRP